MWVGLVPSSTGGFICIKKRSHSTKACNPNMNWVNLYSPHVSSLWRPRVLYSQRLPCESVIFKKKHKPSILIRIRLCFTSPSYKVTRARFFHSSHYWQLRLCSSKSVCLVQTQGPYLGWTLTLPDRPYVQLHLALPSRLGFIAESQREQRE